MGKKLYYVCSYPSYKAIYYLEYNYLNQKNDVSTTSIYLANVYDNKIFKVSSHYLYLIKQPSLYRRFNKMLSNLLLSTDHPFWHFSWSEFFDLPNITNSTWAFYFDETSKCWTFDFSESYVSWPYTNDFLYILDEFRPHEKFLVVLQNIYNSLKHKPMPFSSKYNIDRRFLIGDLESLSVTEVINFLHLTKRNVPFLFYNYFNTLLYHPFILRRDLLDMFPFYPVDPKYYFCHKEFHLFDQPMNRLFKFYPSIKEWFEDYISTLFKGIDIRFKD